MLRFLKYIFLIFGSIALAIMIFFYFQNKEDLKVVWSYYDVIDYKVIDSKCPQNQYFCFTEQFDSMASQVSITGLSLGLKLAFNYLEEAKSRSNSEYKNIEFALKHLEVNNIVIKYTSHRFHGFKKLYGGYIGKMIDFFKSSKKFSQNLIIGLTKSDEGLKSVQDEVIREKYQIRLNNIIQDFKRESKVIQSFIDSEVKRLEKKHEGNEE